MVTSNMLLSAVDKAVQIHGGNGFIWETEVNRHYRNAKIGTIGGGTNEIRRMIIDEELLRAARRVNPPQSGCRCRAANADFCQVSA